jgi:MFS transporter, UMF1 family
MSDSPANQSDRAAQPASAKGNIKDDKRTIFGWCMYDWANSAYITTAVGLLPLYFARGVVGEAGITVFGTHVAPDALWGFFVGLSSFLAFLSAPILGAMADFSAAKKNFLLTFAYTGSLFTILLYFSQSGDVWRTMICFLLANFCFISANVFYDAFLPHIASDEKMDWVSGKGYSYGYIGGGLQFAIALALMTLHEKVGISQGLAARIGIASAGVWWATFTIITARLLREPGVKQERPQRYKSLPALFAYIAIGVTRTFATIRRVGKFRQLLLFLVAFMLYDDGIQTVINMATTYGTVELKLSPTILMLTLLIIQFVAMGGALLFGKIAQKIGAKRTIMATLVMWSGVVMYAYFIRTATEFMTLGVIVGVVMGGSQALSRSFYGSMVPQEASAEFFGFYTVFTKFSSIWGPWTFAIVKQTIGSSRIAILSIIFFFITGLVLLYLVDETRAREAKTSGAF